MERSFFVGKRLTRFEALQARLVPRSTRFSEAERERARALVEQLVGNQPPANRRRLALFLWLIDLFAFLVGLRPFRGLPREKQDRLLHWLFDNPVPLLRKGFWALNTMARLGVYGQPELYDEVGYHLRENPAYG